MNNFKTIRDLYVRTGSKEAVASAYSKGLITVGEYVLILGEEPGSSILEVTIDRKIAESKKMLAAYLESHPLESKCHGNKYDKYSVTEEKQNMFSRKFAAHSALVAAGIEDTMTWNATGKPCEAWTDQECLQFIAETNAYVTPLVSYQQHIEMAIRACKTPEEVEKVEIDYTSLFTTQIPNGGVNEET